MVFQDINLFEMHEISILAAAKRGPQKGLRDSALEGQTYEH